MIATSEARDEGGHRFIGAPDLRLVIRAFVLFAAATFEVVGGGFHLWEIFVLETDAPVLHEVPPGVGHQLLVTHVRQPFAANLPIFDLVQHFFLLKIKVHHLELVHVDQDEVFVRPLPHDVVFGCTVEAVIIDASFDVPCVHWVRNILLDHADHLCPKLIRVIDRLQHVHAFFFLL
jgi:hypothetical protein